MGPYFGTVSPEEKPGPEASRCVPLERPRRRLRVQVNRASLKENSESIPLKINSCKMNLPVWGQRAYFQRQRFFVERECITCERYQGDEFILTFAQLVNLRCVMCL